MPRSTLLALAATVLLVLGALGFWIAEDRFLDREEAQHIDRAIETRDAAFGSAETGPSAKRLLLARLSQPKPWYGWPYYLAVATGWKLFGTTYDAAVYANLLFLLVGAGAAAWWAAQLAGRAAAVPAALFALVAPGALIFTHLASPTVFLFALTTLAAAVVTWTDGLECPRRALLAGFLCGLAGIAKLSVLFGLAPVVLATIWGRWRRRELWRGLGWFALGFAPVLITTYRNRKVLAFWTEQTRALWGNAQWSESLSGLIWRWYEVLMPMHLVLVGAAFVLLLGPRGEGSGRRLAGRVAFWLVVPLFALLVLLRSPGTTRDAVALLGPVSVLVGAAFARLPGAWPSRAVWLFPAYGALFMAVNLFGWGRGESVRPLERGALIATVDGAPWGIRLRPYPDLLTPVLAVVEREVPPATGNRCSCLEVQPHPVVGTGDRPLVLVDSRLIGPENLETWLRLERGAIPWRFAHVPYPLSCGPYRTALACASALVLARPERAGEYPSSEAKVAPLRRLIGDWGRPAAQVLDGEPTGAVELRVPAGRARESACTPPDLVGQRGRFALAVAPCPEDDFYTEFLWTLAGEPAARSAAEVGRLTEARLAELVAGEDAPARAFGEEHLARAVLGRLASLPTQPAGARRADSARGVPSTVLLPASAQRVEWDGAGLPRRVVAGGRFRGTLRFANRGDRTWVDTATLGGPDAAVRLGYRWLDETGRPASRAHRRRDLPKPVEPGETLELELDLEVPKEPGPYRLRLDLLQEGQGWFADAGGEALLVEVEVVP